MKATFAALAVLAAAPLAAQAPPVTKCEAVEITTTIEAIDHTARLVTLKDEQGDSETIYAPPEVKRFDELKVGDKVTFKYSESIAYQIRKPGAAAGAPANKQPTLERGTGADRQLAVFEKAGDLKDVVAYMVEETRAGL